MAKYFSTLIFGVLLLLTACAGNAAQSSSTDALGITVYRAPT